MWVMRPREGTGDLGGVAAKVTGVFPDRHGLGTQSDTVQRGMVAVLARDRDAVHALRGQRRDNATGGAVIGSDNRIDAIVGRGQNLLHVALRVGGQPAIGIGFAHDLDLAGVNRLLQHFLLTAAQEIRVRVGGRALDHDVAAGGRCFQHRAGLHPAHFHVVEGQVEGAGVFDQAVIGDDRNALIGGGLNGGADGLRVLRQDDQRIDTLGDQAFNVRQLLGGRGLRIGRDIGGPGLFQCGDDGGLVGGPTLLLEIGPADADRDALCERRGGEHDRDQSRGESLQKFHLFLPGTVRESPPRGSST
mgnify:CR=1 FL=1